MTFLDYLTSNLTHQNILDLANNGADDGFDGLTYYVDTSLVYDEHEAEIWDALTADAEDLGYGNVIRFISSLSDAEWVTDADGFKNLLVCYMAEREARRYADAVEQEVA